MTEISGQFQISVQLRNFRTAGTPEKCYDLALKLVLSELEALAT